MTSTQSTTIDKIIEAATERGNLTEALTAIDSLTKDHGEVTEKTAGRLLEAIEAGINPNRHTASRRGKTDLYGHRLDSDGLAIVPITGSGTYDPRTPGEKATAKKFLPFNHPNAS